MTSHNPQNFQQIFFSRLKIKQQIQKLILRQQDKTHMAPQVIKMRQQDKTLWAMSHKDTLINFKSIEVD